MGTESSIRSERVKTLFAGSYIIEFGDDKTGGELEFEVK